MIAGKVRFSDSLLLTLEQAFGLSCLQSACDKADGVVPMTPLFRVYGDQNSQ